MSTAVDVAITRILMMTDEEIENEREADPRAFYSAVRGLAAAALAATEETPAARDVLAERRRQIEVEGFAPQAAADAATGVAATNARASTDDAAASGDRPNGEEQ